MIAIYMQWISEDYEMVSESKVELSIDLVLFDESAVLVFAHPQFLQSVVVVFTPKHSAAMAQVTAIVAMEATAVDIVGRSLAKATAANKVALEPLARLICNLYVF